MQVRRTPDGLPFFKTMAGRRLLKQALAVLAAFIVGYLPTMCWLFPAPLFSQDRTVPRVLDDELSTAQRKLESQGFRPRVDEEQTDAAAPKGVVIWQDPPPLTIAPPNTHVSLILSAGPSDVGVPDVVGFPEPLAERVVKAGGFKRGGVDTVPSPTEAGLVVSTSPPAATARPAGSTVDLVVSSGPAEIAVPNLSGLTIQESRERLVQAGLDLGAVTFRSVAGRTDATVVSQRPDAGTLAARHTRVDLVINRRRT
jgi:serine/threonine-protein kinase